MKFTKRSISDEHNHIVKDGEIATFKFWVKAILNDNIKALTHDRFRRWLVAKELTDVLRESDQIKSLKWDNDNLIHHEEYRKTMQALSLARLTMEVSQCLMQAEIPVLVIKGVALALQSTGRMNSRLSSDLDIFISSKHLNSAILNLCELGFRVMENSYPTKLNSFAARFCCWSGYEMSLVRNKGLGLDVIDLHWHLTNFRDRVPSFEKCWENREILTIHGQDVFTLSLYDSFIYSCAHAAKDQWESIKHLLDIYRLSQRLTADQARSLGSNRLVRQSCAATYDTLGGGHLLNLIDIRSNESRLAIYKARRAQSYPPRQEWIHNWSLKLSFKIIGWWAFLSRDPQDWLRIAMQSVLPASSFCNPNSHSDVGFIMAATIRMARVVKKLKR